MIEELISILLGATIGGIIGSIISYFISKRLIEVRVLKNQAYSFIEKHYLPFLTALRLTIQGYLLLIWFINPNNELFESKKISKKELEKLSPLYISASQKVLVSELMKFQNKIEKFMESGVLILIEQIDPEIAILINTLHFRFQVFALEPELNKLIDKDMKLLIDELYELANKISELSISEIIKEYQKAMKFKHTYVLKDLLEEENEESISNNE